MVLIDPPRIDGMWRSIHVLHWQRGSSQIRILNTGYPRVRCRIGSRIRCVWRGHSWVLHHLWRYVCIVSRLHILYRMWCWHWRRLWCVNRGVICIHNLWTLDVLNILGSWLRGERLRWLLKYVTLLWRGRHSLRWWCVLCVLHRRRGQRRLTLRSLHRHGDNNHLSGVCFLSRRRALNCIHRHSVVFHGRPYVNYSIILNKTFSLSEFTCVNSRIKMCCAAANTVHPAAAVLGRHRVCAAETDCVTLIWRSFAGRLAGRRRQHNTMIIHIHRWRCRLHWYRLEWCLVRRVAPHVKFLVLVIGRK